MSNPVCDAGTLAGVAQCVVNDLARGWCWGSASSPIPSMDKRTGPEGDDNSRRLLALCAGQGRRGWLEWREGVRLGYAGPLRPVAGRMTTRQGARARDRNPKGGDPQGLREPQATRARSRRRRDDPNLLYRSEAVVGTGVGGLSSRTKNSNSPRVAFSLECRRNDKFPCTKHHRISSPAKVAPNAFCKVLWSSRHGSP